ncbi:hypothetical protein DVU_0754 [Nitratidesulfovibrio vulgaris str. Hildenborough]|uniref:Uncharacterized protein n=1 Tax=Nitratidesulfovibrio vulgaris (strain ATCC 29579 / DSM 644 / CCUG 34227 / NCIMB 8303 / VKM B-1760 / Hildenborough) TaxID=882 RepID=Q72E25_NITV2|nr:hypothetical protein DVU_0754 [Nitratidesulfovibrio vulgaris str. Hildenborough]
MVAASDPANDSFVKPTTSRLVLREPFCYTGAGAFSPHRTERSIT